MLSMLIKFKNFIGSYINYTNYIKLSKNKTLISSIRYLSILLVVLLGMLIVL